MQKYIYKIGPSSFKSSYIRTLCSHPVEHTHINYVQVVIEFIPKIAFYRQFYNQTDETLNLKKNVSVSSVTYFNWIHFSRISFSHYFHEIKPSHYFAAITWDTAMSCLLFHFIERKPWGVYRPHGNLIYKTKN